MVLAKLKTLCPKFAMFCSKLDSMIKRFGHHLGITVVNENAAANTWMKEVKSRILQAEM